MKTALILEPDEPFGATLDEVLQHRFPGISILRLQTVDQYQCEIKRRCFDIALINLERNNDGSLTLIDELATHKTYCIAVSEHDDEQLIINALRAGAMGYLLTHHTIPQLNRLLAKIEVMPPLSPKVICRLVKHFQPQNGSCHGSLSVRESEVLNLIAKGCKLPQVATQLGISRHTCAEYVKNIYSKLNISSRAEAALAAVRLGIL